MEAGVSGGLLGQVSAAILHVAQVTQVMLIPRAHLLLRVSVVKRLALLRMQMVELLLDVSAVGRQMVHSSCAGWSGPQGSGFLLSSDDAVGRWKSRGAVHGHPRAGADEQVSANGTGVGDLTLTHGSGPRPVSSGLTKLVDLMHNGSQIAVATLLKTRGHRERNG